MKRRIALLLALITAAQIVALSLSFSAGADGTTDSVDGTAFGMPYYYRDAYFASDATVYDPSLATMSYVLARAGFGGGEWATQYRSLFDLFGQIGFYDCDVNEDFRTEPDTDTVGVGMAHKEIYLDGKTYTLIAIVPRSANYEAEWASNFTLGASGEAAGFSAAAAEAERFAAEYVAKYRSHFSENIKLWMVGYSRGGAVANIAAGHVTRKGKIGTLPVKAKDVYAYTFEAPRGVTKDVISETLARSYKNIHNVLSANDLVTKVAPASFGFFRYGKDETVIPDKRTKENAAFFEFALQYLPASLRAKDKNGKDVFATETFRTKKITSDLSKLTSLGTWENTDGTYRWKSASGVDLLDLLTVDTDKSMGAFLDDLMKTLSSGVGSRKKYASDLEDLVRLLMRQTMSDRYGSAAWDRAVEKFTELCEEYAESILVAALTSRTSVLEQTLTDMVKEAIDYGGLEGKEYEDLPAQVAKAVPLVSKVVTSDVLSGGYGIATLLANADLLFLPHYPEQVSAWLRALDPNYNPAVRRELNRVTDVQIRVIPKTTVKRYGIFSLKLRSYDVVITPVCALGTPTVAYRTLRFGKLTQGDSFSKRTGVDYLYLEVTDASGTVTHWQYQYGRMSQVR